MLTLRNYNQIQYSLWCPCLFLSYTKSLLTCNPNPIYCRSETQLRLVFSSLHFKCYPPLLVSLPPNLYPILSPPDSMRVLLYPPTHSLLSTLARVPLPRIPGEEILYYICSCSMAPSMCGLVLSMVVQFLWSLGRDGGGVWGVSCWFNSFFFWWGCKPLQVL